MDAIQTAMGWTNSHLHGSGPASTTARRTSRRALVRLRLRRRLGPQARGRGGARRAVADGTVHRRADGLSTRGLRRHRRVRRPGDVGAQRPRRRALPQVFEHAAHAHDWLPPDWHPGHFELADQLEQRVIRWLSSATRREPSGWSPCARVGSPDCGRRAVRTGSPGPLATERGKTSVGRQGR